MTPTDDSPLSTRKNPNFLLVVLLAGVALVIILVASFFTIDWEGKRIVPRAHGQHPHPTSMRQLPTSPARSV